jgi:hypothetical protein
MNTNIREKVAELNGYTMIDATTTFSPFTGESSCEIKGFKGDSYELIPFYELSLDAIAAAFNEHKITWALDGDGYAYHIKNGLKTETYAETPALALCKLFIDLREKQNHV